MLLLRKPSAAAIHRFLASQANLDVSYPAVGATSATAPPGYVVDHTRMLLGRGEPAFAAAKAALQGWEHFNLGWVQLCWPDTAPEVGRVVAVLAHVSGVWWLNACRIIYVMNEQGRVKRFGFAYGTLPEHAESGEERFTIEWHPDDSVWYDILAFSRPNRLIVRLGYPLVRSVQKRFARDSARAMQLAVAKTK
jgi:uncharacterized protein (UPF0548 family)